MEAPKLVSKFVRFLFPTEHCKLARFCAIEQCHVVSCAEEESAYVDKLLQSWQCVTEPLVSDLSLKIRGRRIWYDGGWLSGTHEVDTAHHATLQEAVDHCLHAPAWVA